MRSNAAPMKAVESHYNRLPAPFQDLVCSAYGMQEAWRRRGSPSGTRRSMELAEDLHRNASTRKQVVENRLSNILSLASTLPAYSHAPAYDRNRSARDQLADWPMMTKPELRAAPERFLTRPVRRSDIRTTTSGTTGTPLTIWQPRSVTLELFRSVDLMRSWHGVGTTGRRASFTGKVAVPLESSRIWRLNAAGRQIVLSQYHLNARNIVEYHNALNMWSPVVLDGYTSNLLDLARLLEEAGLYNTIPLVVTTCETLSLGGRQLLARVFGGSIVDQYATSEHASLAAECPRGQRHVFENVGIIEVVDDDGDPCPPGEVGRLLLTTTTNSLMPLVRYEVGDTGALDEDVSCGCGRSTPVLQNIAGRTDDTIMSPSGVPVAIFAFNLLRGLDNVSQMQVVQHSLSRFTVTSILNALEERSEYESAIARRFDALLGEDPVRRLQFEYPDTIERTPGGKVRNVIREFA